MTRHPVITGANAIFAPTRVGRPPDERLAALDDELARAVIAGDYEGSVRVAAKRNVERYAEREYKDYEEDAKNNKIREVQERIKRRIKELHIS